MVNGQRVLSNIGLGDDVGIWEGSIVYEVLYLVFKAEAVIDFVARFLVVVAIFIDFPSEGMRLGMGVGSKGLMKPLQDRFSYAWVRVIPRSDGELSLGRLVFVGV